MKKEKAITLISLVITIIVLVILAGVGIYLSLGNNGIFVRSKQAKEATNKQEATDIINLKITNCQINKYAEKQEMPTLKELSLVLKNDNEIEYVTETSKVASTEYDVPSDTPTSIYTKLSKYPYEFEINGNLQLASINGVKVANSNIQNINQPTGIKTDVYIKNSITSKAGYSNMTSMSGLEISKDENSKIDEYLSYSSADGYTVLKGGWYYIKLGTQINHSNNAGTFLYFYVNGREVGTCRAYTNSSLRINDNSFSIILNEGDKIYFSSNGAASSVHTREAIGECYPMF